MHPVIHKRHLSILTRQALCLMLLLACLAPAIATGGCKKVGSESASGAGGPNPELATPKKAAVYFFKALVTGDVEAARRSSVGAEPMIDAFKNMKDMQASFRRFDETMIKKFGEKGKLPVDTLHNFDMASGLADIQKGEADTVEKIEGDHATLLSKSDPNDKHPLTLRREAGEWKVEGDAFVDREIVEMGKASRKVADSIDALTQKIESGMCPTPEQGFIALGIAAKPLEEVGAGRPSPQVPGTGSTAHGSATDNVAPASAVVAYLTQPNLVLVPAHPNTTAPAAAVEIQVLNTNEFGTNITGKIWIDGKSPNLRQLFGGVRVNTNGGAPVLADIAISQQLEPKDVDVNDEPECFSSGMPSPVTITGPAAATVHLRAGNPAEPDYEMVLRPDASLHAAIKKRFDAQAPRYARMLAAAWWFNGPGKWQLSKEQQAKMDTVQQPIEYKYGPAIQLTRRQQANERKEIFAAKMAILAPEQIAKQAVCANMADLGGSIQSAASKAASRTFGAPVVLLADLDPVVDVVLADGKSLAIFLSPDSGKTVPPEIDAKLAVDKREWVCANTDYVYLGKGLTWNTPNAPILVEKPRAGAAADSSACVLYAGGHMRIVTAREALQLIGNPDAGAAAAKLKDLKARSDAAIKKRNDDAHLVPAPVPAPRIDRPALPATAPAVSTPAPAALITNKLGMKFVRISAGEFTMGSPLAEPGRNGIEKPHKVRITKPFYLGAYTVTRGQFARFVDETHYKTTAETVGWGFGLDGIEVKQINGLSWRNPGFGQADDHPVVEVSYLDAIEYIKWLNAVEKAEGRHYRLPTEAEYEYACRAGAQAAYFWGNNPDDGAGFANCADQTLKEKFPQWQDTFHWRDKFVFTAPVGSFRPNAWGLYDMTGNAWSWCSDYFAPYGGDAQDPTGPPTGDQQATRVLRGGDCVFFPPFCRSASRLPFAQELRGCTSGFRLCLDAR